MHRDEDEICSASHRVPTREPVGSDPAFQRWEPRHERDQHHDGVARQQPGHATGVGQPVAEAADRWGVMPPQPDDQQGTEDDADKKRVRIHCIETDVLSWAKPERFGKSGGYIRITQSK